MEMEELTQFSPHACPPIFRPPPLLWELPRPNVSPPLFSPSAVYNETLLLQSCPSCFRPSIKDVESSAATQLETKYLSGDLITYKPENCLGDRPEFCHDKIWVSSMYGAADRHGWYFNGSFAGVGRVCERRFVDPLGSQPYVMAREPRDGHLANLYLGATLDNEIWRQVKLKHGRSLSPLKPVSKVPSPLASYPQAFWPGKIPASTREVGKRRCFEAADNALPSLKCPRTRHKMDSRSWARCRRESEVAWLSGLRFCSDRFAGSESTYCSPSHTQKQTENMNESKFSHGPVDCCLDRQESRTRRRPPCYQRSSLSFRARNIARVSLEVSQNPEIRCRPRSVRPISQSDRSTRASPRPFCSNGIITQYRNNPSFDVCNRPSSRGSWFSRSSPRTRSPSRCSNLASGSLRVDHCRWRRDCSPLQLLARDSDYVLETDKHIVHWSSADGPDIIEKNAEENGSWTIFPSSRVGEEHSKYDRSQSDFQVLDVVGKQTSQQCFAESSVAQVASNSVDNMAQPLTDRIKNEKAFSLPVRSGTTQTLLGMKRRAEQCGSLEKKLPLHRNAPQPSDEKAGLTGALHARTIRCPISATSLEIARYFFIIRSTLKYYASQDPEVDWEMFPVKVTPWTRRAMIISAGFPLDKISGFDENAALPAKEQDEAQEQDVAQEGEILLKKKTFKSLLAPVLLLQRCSIASEPGAVEGGVIEPFVGLSIASSDVSVHLPSEVRGTDSQVDTFSVVNSVSAVKKWIFTGFRSKHILSVNPLTSSSGSDLHSPEYVVKSQNPCGCLLADDAAGCLRSERMEEVLPALTVRHGWGILCAGVDETSDIFSARGIDLLSLAKEQEICTPGNIKSEIASLKDSAAVPETPEQKLSYMVEKSFLRVSSAHEQNLERCHLGTESLLSPSCRSFVGCARVNSVVAKSESLLDDWLFGITSLIPLAAETNKRFEPNFSTSESPKVFEEKDPLPFEGDNKAEQLCGLFREKTTSVMDLTRLVTDKMEAAVVERERDSKVVSESSTLLDAPAGKGYDLARQLHIKERGQGDSPLKLASFLTNAGASSVSEGMEMISVLPQRSVLGDSKNAVGNSRAEQLEEVTIGVSASAAKLVRVIMEKGEAALTSSEDNFEEITGTSREVVTTVLRFDRELGKRRKLMHLEKTGNLNKVVIADNPTAKVIKTNVLDLRSGTGKFKGDSNLMKKQMSSLKQCTVPVLNTTDAVPLSSHLLVPPAVTTPLSAVGRSYASNKIWRREATRVNGQEFSTTSRKPALVGLPSTYVRKNFSVTRYPASEVQIESNVGAEPNPLSKFYQHSVIQSRNKKYFLSASKSMEHSHVAKSAASANPNVKTSNAKNVELGVMLSNVSSPSSVRSAHSVGGDSKVTYSESILSDLTPVSKVCPSKSHHCEGSKGLTTSVWRSPREPAGKGTNEMVGYVVSGTRMFRKRKSDQGHDGLSTTFASPEKFGVPVGYMKRKTNQLVRCDHPGASAHDVLQNVVEGDAQVKFVARQRKNSAQLKTKPYRGTPRDWRHSLKFQKFNIVAPRERRSLHEGKMAALFLHLTNQSLKHRSAHLSYTRSADGFSLHRSVDMSKRGANLKGKKYLKTQSVLASETATNYVAEIEKKKMDKKEAVVRFVAKARDEQSAKSISGFLDASINSLGIGGVVYVRKGFGHQLVRNSKTVVRAFACEKYRWSLRNARLRRAKKQDFCVYYMRFGICKRGDGKCLYIHDPDKVAVCAKFLRDSCSDPACRLTHKVTTERLSDCLYFIEGLCTNERCPYRHVYLNKEAPICEAFLQGYCAEGDKCNKKHTYVCPEYMMSGSCLSGGCKLRHPKKKQSASASKDSLDSDMARKVSKRELQKGRYFTLTAQSEGDREGQPVSAVNAAGDKIAGSDDDLLDFISVDEYGSELSKQYQNSGIV